MADGGRPGQHTGWMGMVHRWIRWCLAVECMGVAQWDRMASDGIAGDRIAFDVAGRGVASGSVPFFSGRPWTSFPSPSPLRQNFHVGTCTAASSHSHVRHPHPQLEVRHGADLYRPHHPQHHHLTTSPHALRLRPHLLTRRRTETPSPPPLRSPTPLAEPV